MQIKEENYIKYDIIKTEKKLDQDLIMPIKYYGNDY